MVEPERRDLSLHPAASGRRGLVAGTQRAEGVQVRLCPVRFACHVPRCECGLFEQLRAFAIALRGKGGPVVQAEEGIPACLEDEGQLDPIERPSSPRDELQDLHEGLDEEGRFDGRLSLEGSEATAERPGHGRVDLLLRERVSVRENDGVDLADLAGDTFHPFEEREPAGQLERSAGDRRRARADQAGHAAPERQAFFAGARAGERLQRLERADGVARPHPHAAERLERVLPVRSVREQPTQDRGAKLDFAVRLFLRRPREERSRRLRFVRGSPREQPAALPVTLVGVQLRGDERLVVATVGFAAEGLDERPVRLRGLRVARRELGESARLRAQQIADPHRPGPQQGEDFVDHRRDLVPRPRRHRAGRDPQEEVGRSLAVGPDDDPHDLRHPLPFVRVGVELHQLLGRLVIVGQRVQRALVQAACVLAFPARVLADVRGGLPRVGRRATVPELLVEVPEALERAPLDLRVVGARQDLEDTPVEDRVLVLAGDLRDRLEEGRVDRRRIEHREDAFARLPSNVGVGIGAQDLQVHLQQARSQLAELRRRAPFRQLPLPVLGELAQGEGREGERGAHGALPRLDSAVPASASSAPTRKASRVPGGGD